MARLGAWLLAGGTLGAANHPAGKPPPYKIFEDSFPARRPGHNETEVFEDVLPPALFARLERYCDEYEALQRPDGSGTNFAPLDPHHKPRHPVEEVVQYLARHVVDAGSDWEGVDWWLQFRGVQSPKEYHSDSDTWRLNNFRERWHPQVSSIFWFNDAGGATAIFNQSIRDFGVTPRVPSEVGVIFPRRNQYATFMGDRYHGVLLPSADDPQPDGSTRKTLLINWWKRRPDESQDPDEEVCRRGYQPIYPWSRFSMQRVLGFAAPVAPTVFGLDTSFDQHLAMWIGQHLLTFEEVATLVAEGAEKISTVKAERRWRQHTFLSLNYLKPSQLAKGINDDALIPGLGAWKVQVKDGNLHVQFG